MPTVPQRRPPTSAPTKRERLVVSLSWWNRLVDRWFRERVRSITSLTAAGWRHPWHTRVLIDEAAAATSSVATWKLDVNPGFCLRDPQTGDAPRVLVPAPANDPDAVDAFLGDADPDPAPVLRIAATSALWRKIGTDADPGFAPEEVPRFFAEQGVRAAGRLQVDRVMNSISSVTAAGDPADDPSEARLLRACDLILQVDRPGVRIDWDSPGGGTGLARASFTLVSAPDARSAPWLRLIRRHDPNAAAEEAAVLRDPRALSVSGFVQTTHDDLHLATIYLLSQPGTASGSVPDETWTAHVEHHVFWNVCHTLAIDLGTPPPQPVLIAIPLASGVGQVQANAITAALNDQNALVTAAIDGLKVTGTFGTA